MSLGEIRWLGVIYFNPIIWVFTLWNFSVSATWAYNDLRHPPTFYNIQKLNHCSKMEICKTAWINARCVKQDQLPDFFWPFVGRLKKRSWSISSIYIYIYRYIYIYIYLTFRNRFTLYSFQNFCFHNFIWKSHFKLSKNGPVCMCKEG